MANNLLCNFLLLIVNLILISFTNSQKPLSAINSKGITFNGLGAVSPGDFITIQCPNNDSIWSRGHFNSTSSIDKLSSEKNVQIDKQSLKLINIDFNDSGIYYCENRKFQDNTYRFHLYVIAITNISSGLVPITTINNEFNGGKFPQSTINIKQSINLTCFCEYRARNGQVRIDWQGGAYSKTSTNYTITTSFHKNVISSTLTIIRAYKDRNLYGQHKCICSAVTGASIERSIDLEVMPIFEEFPSSRRVVEGETIVMNCSAWGIPSLIPSLKWSYQGNFVLREGIEAPADSLGFSQLIIKNVTSADRGVYSCHASNAKGNNTASSMLRVKGRYAALWPFIGILIQLFILVGIIVVYEYNKLHKSKEDPSKANAESRNEPDQTTADRGGDPESVRQRLVVKA